MKKMLEGFCNISNGKCLDLENPCHNKLKLALVGVMPALFMGFIIGGLLFSLTSAEAFGWLAFLGIAFVGIYFGVIPSGYHYFKHYKEFKESAKNWVSAEDELKSIKEYEKNKNWLYSLIFFCFYVCISLIFVYVYYITLFLLYAVEANSAIQTSSVLPFFYLWFLVLTALLVVFGIYILIFQIYVRDPEKFQESIDKFKKRKEVKKDVS